MNVWKRFVQSKAGQIIIAFVSGIATALIAVAGLNAGRNRDARRNIRELEYRLSEYSAINDRLKSIVAEYHAGLLDLREDYERIVATNRELAAESEYARTKLNELRSAINSGAENSGELERISAEVRTESERISSGIKKLGEFIEKYGNRDYLAENPLDRE